jgi:hypothetical protein
MVQKPAFPRVPGTNKNFNITQNSSVIFKLTQKETNRYATQQINNNKKEGLLTPQSVFAQWHTVSLQEIKKFLRLSYT